MGWPFRWWLPSPPPWARSNGILVRNRLALEGAREIDMVVFDKTGTLTKGEFGVVGMAVPRAGMRDHALALAAAIEGDSEHLIARAIRQGSPASEGLQLPGERFRGHQGARGAGQL